MNLSEAMNRHHITPCLIILSALLTLPSLSRADIIVAYDFGEIGGIDSGSGTDT